MRLRRGSCLYLLNKQSRSWWCGAAATSLYTPTMWKVGPRHCGELARDDAGRAMIGWIEQSMAWAVPLGCLLGAS